MFWLAFLLLAVALYTPPLSLADHLWWWAERQDWRMALDGSPAPPWLAYVFWLAVIYLALGTLLHLVHRRLPADSRLGRLALRLARADLGGLGVLVALAAGLTVLLAWPILPACRLMYGWRYGISLPVATLAGLYLLAEALRMAESHLWADRAFAAWRRSWLVEQGHHR